MALSQPTELPAKLSGPVATILVLTFVLVGLTVYLLLRTLASEPPFFPQFDQAQLTDDRFVVVEHRTRTIEIHSRQAGSWQLEQTIDWPENPDIDLDQLDLEPNRLQLLYRDGSYYDRPTSFYAQTHSLDGGSWQLTQTSQLDLDWLPRNVYLDGQALVSSDREQVIVWRLGDSGWVEELVVGGIQALSDLSQPQPPTEGNYPEFLGLADDTIVLRASRAGSPLYVLRRGLSGWSLDSQIDVGSYRLGNCPIWKANKLLDLSYDRIAIEVSLNSAPGCPDNWHHWLVLDWQGSAWVATDSGRNSEGLYQSPAEIDQSVDPACLESAEVDQKGRPYHNDRYQAWSVRRGDQLLVGTIRGHQVGGLNQSLSRGRAHSLYLLRCQSGGWQPEYKVQPNPN